MVCLIAEGKIKPNPNLSPTRFDWTELSMSICADHATAYDKYHAIYRWLCDSISYDITYRYNTADEAYLYRRGMCQAYSELFCRLAEVQGLRAELVQGRSKSDSGLDDGSGHSWIVAYTEDGRGILIDPTWGAGSVENRSFIHRANDESWFDVRPEWFIFTHIPSNEAFQLLNRKVSFSEFEALPALKPFYAAYGYDAAKTLNRYLGGGTVDMPKIYHNLHIVSASVPRKSRLEVGQYCSVALDTDYTPEELAFAGEATNGNNGVWERQGDRIYGTVLITRGGRLVIGNRKPAGGYNVLVEYEVPEPTPEQLEAAEAIEPFSSPVWDTVEGSYNSVLRGLNLDFAALLRRIKDEGITQLPVFYTGATFEVGNIPWHRKLHVGESYTFEIYPYGCVNAAVVNETDWYCDWRQEASNQPWTITVKPARTGSLKIAVQLPSDDSYTICFAYDVE